MQVKKRRVFYIAGFDPRGVGAYHRLFSDEARLYAGRIGAALEVGPRKREDPLWSTWKAERVVGGDQVETTFEFPHWDDIARQHWHGGYIKLYLLAFKTYWRWIVSCNILFDVLRIAKWNFLTGIAPAIVLFVLPALAVLTGWGGHAAGEMLAPGTDWLSWLLAGAGFTGVLALGWWIERVFTLGWLLRTYNFVLDHSLGAVPEMEERMDRFAERIANYVRNSDDDEIIVVGHSVGANVAVSVIARALALEPRLCAGFKPVGLLTLGGSIPMQGLLPWAGRFREELAQLATHEPLPWVDVSAHEDAASFAMLNPVAASGVTVESSASARPRVVSGAFKDALSPETYTIAQWNLFRMHFQYLMAGELVRPNDYFSITTDAVPFRERFPEGANLES